MLTALTIARKEVAQRLRDKSFLIVGILSPLVLAFIFNLVLGDIVRPDPSLTFDFGVVDEGGASARRCFRPDAGGGRGGRPRHRHALRHRGGGDRGGGRRRGRGGLHPAGWAVGGGPRDEPGRNHQGRRQRQFQHRPGGRGGDGGAVRRNRPHGEPFRPGGAGGRRGPPTRLALRLPRRPRRSRCSRRRRSRSGRGNSLRRRSSSPASASSSSSSSWASR